MKKIISLSSNLLIALSSILVQCKKNNLELNGTASTADFSFAIIPLQDTLPFAYMVSFTNGTEEGLQYQWDFGDNTALSSEKNPKHLYSVGGEYIVKLTSVGTNGNNTISKGSSLLMPARMIFTANTGCNNFVWTWVQMLMPSVYYLLMELNFFFAGAAAGCQADDANLMPVANLNMMLTVRLLMHRQDSVQAPKAMHKNLKWLVLRQLPEIILIARLRRFKTFYWTTDVIDGIVL
jgi:hypothetical protein